MKNAVLFLIITFLAFVGCTENEPEFCTPLKAVELMKNHPKMALSKTQTGYYEIAGEDEKFIYFGYRTLNLKLEPKLDPFYKTSKTEFNLIFEKTSGLDIGKAEAMINLWFLTKYPELKFDSINKAQTITIKFQHNKRTDRYDAKCSGWIEFYYSRMERSSKPGIDSVMTNYTLKKFDYLAWIKTGNNIELLKEKMRK